MSFDILLLLLELLLLALTLLLIPLIADLARMTLFALTLITRLYLFVLAFSLASMLLSFSVYGSLFLLLF